MFKAGFGGVKRVVLAAAIVSAPVGAAAAQNVGGVFGPVVNADHRLAQYRVTFDPDSEGLAQRFHYEQALDDDFMLRGVIGARKTFENDVDFDYVRGELFWDLSEDGAAYRTGLRFDGVVRSDDRPGSIGVNWMNQWALNEQWSARFVALSAVQLGDNAADGVFIQTRGALNYANPNGPNLGLELYNSYGSTDNFAEFEQQRHQIGPTASFSFANQWSAYTNVLVGLTEASPDTELRLWVTRRF